MQCPHCLVHLHPQTQAVEISNTHSQGVWYAYSQICPSCLRISITLVGQPPGSALINFIAYPKATARPVAPEVPDTYGQDFTEASLVLGDSPKASAALSRRCLQAIFRDKAGTKSNDLYDQIEEVINSGKVPSHIIEGLHAVRNIGNFATHTMKSTVTGSIVDVEPGEAEWNLDVLESLFDFYFVQPALSAKRKEELNKKLKDAGKPEIK